MPSGGTVPSYLVYWFLIKEIGPCIVVESVSLWRKKDVMLPILPSCQCPPPGYITDPWKSVKLLKLQEAWDIVKSDRPEWDDRSASQKSGVGHQEQAFVVSMNIKCIFRKHNKPQRRVASHQTEERPNSKKCISASEMTPYLSSRTRTHTSSMREFSSQVKNSIVSVKTLNVLAFC